MKIIPKETDLFVVFFSKGIKYSYISFKDFMWETNLVNFINSINGGTKLEDIFAIYTDRAEAEHAANIMYKNFRTYVDSLNNELKAPVGT